MRRNYSNFFKYAGLTRLSHCEGEQWEEVWADPAWETKPVTANRARFLWGAILKERPDLETEYRPNFVIGRKYILSITQDDTSGRYPHILRASRA